MEKESECLCVSVCVCTKRGRDGGEERHSSSITHCCTVTLIACNSRDFAFASSVKRIMRVKKTLVICHKHTVPEMGIL